MLNDAIKRVFKQCAKYYNRFDIFYQNKLKQPLFEYLEANKEMVDDDLKFMLKTNKDVFLCEFNKDRKNQKQMLFLVSRYNLDRTILYESFRFDLDKQARKLKVVDWHLDKNDYNTINMEIDLNEEKIHTI